MKTKASIQALPFSGQIVDPKGEMNFTEEKETHTEIWCKSSVHHKTKEVLHGVLMFYRKKRERKWLRNFGAFFCELSTSHP